MNQKVKLWRVFVDLDLDSTDNNGSIHVLVKGTSREISKLLYKKYPHSHFTMDEMPTLVTIKTFEKMVK